MDLWAYSQINDYSHIMKENGISVPRLRGIRLMKEETPMTEEEIQKEADYIGYHGCEDLCRSGFRTLNPDGFGYSKRIQKIVNKHILYDKNGIPCGANWKIIHGKKRKMFKYMVKKGAKKVRRVYETFNKYCGAENVLYIHARIGGANWNYFGGQELAKQPWFIEKVDDAFDCTYCDIYARIKELPNDKS